MLEKINSTLSNSGSNKVVEMDTELAEVHAKMGMLYAELESWPESIAYYQRAIALSPNSVETYIKLAQVWLKLGRQDKAIEAYVALSGCYLNQLGLLLAQQNKWGEVFKCYQQICNLALNQTAIYSQLGFNLVRQRWLDQTIDIDVKKVSLLPITYNPSPLCQSEKVRINMVGGGFQHSVCSSALNNNEYVEWVKDYSADLSIHIDEGIFYEVNDNKKKFAWLAESSLIISHLIEKVKDNLDWILSTYQYIFCNDKRLLNIHPKFKFALPNAKPYIQNKQIYEKTKLISMIVSNKTMCEGHIYRLAMLEKYQASLDHFGRGFGNKELPFNMIFNNREETGKILALKDYMFSIAMENANYPGCFCEKITDCFATGTIPIYWGAIDIDNYFNEDGIIKLTEDFDISSLSSELYKSKQTAIVDNFNRALTLPSAEDYIYLTYLK